MLFRYKNNEESITLKSTNVIRGSFGFLFFYFKKMSKQYKEGIHYYYEKGLMVLTEKFHLERGYCCQNGCRHCPYDKDNRQKENSE